MWPLTISYQTCLMYLPIFIIKCRHRSVAVVKDYTLTTNFVLFHKPVEKVINKKAAILIKIQEGDIEHGKVIANYLNKYLSIYYILHN